MACGCPKPCRGWSGRSSVFVDESAAACRSDDSKLLLPVGVWRLRRSWGSLIERAVGPVNVVVVDVVDHEVFELVLVPDGGAVEEFASQGADPVVSVQHCELVTQHDDPEVLRASRAHSQACQRHQQPVQDATHGLPGCKRIMPGQRARPYFGHPQARSEDAEGILIVIPVEKLVHWIDAGRRHGMLVRLDSRP